MSFIQRFRHDSLDPVHLSMMFITISFFFTVDIAVGDGIQLNCALLEKPNFTSGMVVTEHKVCRLISLPPSLPYFIVIYQGEFFSDALPHIEIPFSPLPIPPPLPPLPKMGYIWMTDYMINTATLVYGRAGRLDYSYNITHDMVRYIR